MDAEREMNLARAVNIFARAAVERVLEPSDTERSAFLVIRLSLIESWVILLAKPGTAPGSVVAPPGDPTTYQLEEAADRIMKTVCEELRRDEVAQIDALSRMRTLAREIATRLMAGLPLYPSGASRLDRDTAFSGASGEPEVVVTEEELEEAVARLAATGAYDLVATAQAYADYSFAHRGSPSSEELAGILGTPVSVVEQNLRKFTDFLRRGIVPAGLGAARDQESSPRSVRRVIRFTYAPHVEEVVLSEDDFMTAIELCEVSGESSAARAARMYVDSSFARNGHPPSNDDLASSMGIKAGTVQGYLRTFSLFLPGRPRASGTT